MTKDEVMEELLRLMRYYRMRQKTDYWEHVVTACFMSRVCIQKNDLEECVNSLTWWKSTVETHPKFKKPHLAMVIYDRVTEWVKTNMHEYDTSRIPS